MVRRLYQIPLLFVVFALILIAFACPTLARAQSAAAILYDATIAANGTLDTGPIDTSRHSCVSLMLVTSGNTTASVSHEIYDASGTALAIDTGVLVTANTRFVGSWGEGCSYARNGLLGLATALPPRIRIQIGALGAGVTGRFVIIGRKN